jgi:CIC family chloride channel protein
VIRLARERRKGLWRKRAGRAAAWLRSQPIGLGVITLLVGLVAGAGAIVFRLMIFGFTAAFTGHANFGQQGRIASAHFPFLGIWFYLLAPIIAGLIFGPLIYFFAREARGHGVPEVMLAVAENGGRIRPQVAVVKALASSLCIGGGGSVGREGPIVQIGSAFGSTIGQLIRMSEGRMRILAACGAAGGISGTFNAPITGAFFGLELILQELSLEATVLVLVASAAADVVSRLAFGGAPIFNLPALSLSSDWDYLFCAVLGVVAAIGGVGFKTVLYRTEDLFDRLWRGRPEWARPAVFGGVLGLILLAVPQLYGVGYPVLEHVIANPYALWFLVVLVVGKIVAASVTIGIGGSGGVFAPSLFIGAALGTAYGVALHALVGPLAGPPAVYGMIAMGAVFGAAARAPITAVASVFEMTGDHSIVVALMITVAISTGISRRLSYGSIYTTKLLRRGIDIDRPRPSTLWQQLRVAEVMRPVPEGVVGGRELEEVMSDLLPLNPAGEAGAADVSQAPGPHALFPNETLEQALRQLLVYGRQGLPVMGEDGDSVVGWLDSRDLLREFGRRLGQTARQTPAGARAASWGADSPALAARTPHNLLRGYSLVSVVLRDGDPAAHQVVREVQWPPGSLVVAVRRGGLSAPPRGDTRLEPGDRVTVLLPSALEDAVRALLKGGADHGGGN